MDEALQIADNALNFLTGSSTRAVSREIAMNNITLILSPSTRSAGNDTLLYVVNYADNNGFVVISANKNTEGLLAVTETGNYNPTISDYTENQGFATFMDMAKSYTSA